jgi:broad specificity phosphatase PhoE
MSAPTLPSSMDRRRRRRLRLIPIIGYTIVALGFAYFFTLRPSTTVILVRHADTDQAMRGADDDPPLNARGRARAELLADFLEHIDVVAGPNAIYASDKRRTQETAAPIAKRLGLNVEIADHLDAKGFIADLLDDHYSEIVLIVSHFNTILPLIDELHGNATKRSQPFASDEYDRVYIVNYPWYGKVKTYELRYPEPPVVEPPAVSAAPSVEAPASVNGSN